MPVFRRQAAVVAAAAVAASAALVCVASPAAAINAFPKEPNKTVCNFQQVGFLLQYQSIWRNSAAHPNDNILRSSGIADSDGNCDSTLAPYLVLQSDGNLVEYSSDGGQVLFTTHTTTGEKLTFQGDHNVVLYDKAGKPLWYTKTANTDAVYFGPYGNGELVTQREDGQFVSTVGTAMTKAPGVVVGSAQSPDGTYSLAVQSDGNLVEYKSTTGGRQAVWNTHTAGNGPVRLAAQLDGNLVLYSQKTGKALWSSHTATGTTAYRQLDLQNDGDLTLWTTDGVSRTHQLWTNGVAG